VEPTDSARDFREEEIDELSAIRAIADYNKAIKLDPKYVPAKEGLKRLGASP
jgi:hypothetical protein